MQTYDVQSVKIDQPAARVFEYVSQPRHLQEWTNAFKSADESSAELVTPNGTVPIRLDTRANVDAGTVDWIMTFPDGTAGATGDTRRGVGRAEENPRHGASGARGKNGRMIRLDADIVRAARQGDRAALASVVSAVEQPVFVLAIRMLANRADAEDATQEILVKIITHLGTLQDDGAAGGWALKIASRHLVAIRKRGRVEAMRMSSHDFAEDLETGLDQSAVTQMDDVVTAVAIEEIKIGCTLAMLTCLKRNSRIAYILGDIFEMTDSEASEVLQIAPATYRQQLRRARGGNAISSEDLRQRIDPRDLQVRETTYCGSGQRACSPG